VSRRPGVRDPLVEAHVPGCRTRIAAECAVPIECHHGYDVCPECDPCTCSRAGECVVCRRPRTLVDGERCSACKCDAYVGSGGAS
jgi:hypothetical protein